MKTALLRQNKSRWPAAHATLAVLALAGAVGLQWLWKSPTPTKAESWRLYVPALLLFTSAWLLTTAWFHFRLAKRNTTSSRPLLQALADLAVAILAAIILAQGHTSLLALTGLWPLAPLLIAIAAPSAVLLTGTLAAGHQHARPPVGRNLAATLRLVICAALLISLAILASQPLPGRTQTFTPASSVKASQP